MIEETIKTVATCLKAGVHPNFIRRALVNGGSVFAKHGLTPQRAETLILWAKQLNERESNGK